MNNTVVHRKLHLKGGGGGGGVLLASLLLSPDTGIQQGIPMTELFLCALLKVCVEAMTFFFNPLI